MRKETIELGNGHVIEKVTLDNGLRLIYQKIPNGCVTLNLGIKFGSNREKESDLGAAHFIEHMLFRGTSELTNREVLESIDEVGGNWDAATSEDITSYFIKVQNRHVDRAINLLYDILFNSVFGPGKLNVERKVILQELIKSNDDIDDCLAVLFYKILYQKHPMRNPILGTEETLSSLKRDTIIGYHSRFYVPNNMVLCMIGEINDDILHLINDRFGKVPSKQLPPLDEIIEPKQERKEVVEEKQNLEGVHIMLGTQLRGNRGIIHYTHPDSYVMAVIDCLLTGSMTSRLRQEITEKRGFSYDIDSTFDSADDYSCFSVGFTTTKDVANKALDLVFTELRRLQNEPVSEAELERVKTIMESQQYLNNTNDDERSETFVKYELLDGGIEEFTRFTRQVRAVTQEDILRVARNYIDIDNFITVKILPKS